MAMIKVTAAEIEAYMTPERMREEEERAAKLSFEYDPDCPPLTEEMIKARNFHRVNPHKQRA